MTAQEVIALVLVAFAAAFLVRKLGVWPRRSSSLSRPNAQLSPRLRRALRRAERGHKRERPESKRS